MHTASQSGSLRHRLRTAPKLVMMLVVAMVLLGCGSSAESVEAAERDPIRLQAPNVNSELIVFDDLGDKDTVLWFWAPW